MRIEEGKFYRTRLGERVGPTRAARPGVYRKEFTWYVEAHGAVRDDGSYSPDSSVTEDDGDLVAEWVDEETQAASDPVSLTNERKGQHGDWAAQSQMADNLMLQITTSANWAHMGPGRRQALFNIAQKISRICTGDPDHADHWDDIAGYAYLGKGGHAK